MILRFIQAAGAVAVASLLTFTAGAVLMPEWRVSASEVSTATPEQIWVWYANAERTPNWDHLVSVRKINGPFTTGTGGSNRGSQGPAFPWTFTDVVTLRHYTEVTRLPLATLTGTHVLTPVPGGTQIDHALIVAGPLAWVYRLAFHQSFDNGIHAALRRLAAGAPSGPPPTHRLE